jgi:tetratricopeptide (TPR) repeat protein
MHEKARRGVRTAWLVLVIGAPLALSGCLGTLGTAGIGGREDESEVQARARLSEERAVASQDERKPPDAARATAEELAKDTSFQIRQLLDQAGRAKQLIFSDPLFYRIQVTTDKKDKDGQPVLRSYHLLTFNDRVRRDAINLARELYERVLEMDANNLQATLGLGELALVDATTLVTEQQRLTVRLDGDEEMSESERVQTTKRRTLVERRVDSTARAAQEKFRRVLAISPTESAAHLGMAMSLALTKKWGEAAARFDAMEKEGYLPPRNRSVVFVWYGFVLEQMGQRDKAMEKYSTAAAFQEPYAWGEWAADRVETLYVFQ